MLLSAFLVAWGAEAAQFLISQGLALAILAWLQTLPEFAVEAVIAWHAGKDPVSCFVAEPPAGCTSHLAIANFTGAIRLLVGLGWPMIYAVAAARARRHGAPLRAIHLDEQHAVEVLGTVPPLLWFVWIWWKGSLDLIDAAVLVAMYAVYLAILWRLPPEREEGLHEAPAVSRWARADGDDEHDVQQHQSVDRARRDDPDRVLVGARRAGRAPVRRRAALG